MLIYWDTKLHWASRGRNSTISLQVCVPQTEEKKDATGSLTEHLSGLRGLFLWSISLRLAHRQISRSESYINQYLLLGAHAHYYDSKSKLLQCLYVAYSLNDSTRTKLMKFVVGVRCETFDL